MRAPTINLNEIHSMTDFLRNAKSYAQHLKKTGQPAVLTVNGQAELVVQDAKSYQQLLDLASEAKHLAQLQRSIAEMKAGKVHDFDEIFDALEGKHFGKRSKK